MINPIQITLQNIYKELSAVPVNWLLANVGDKIRIETSFKIENVVLSDSDNPFMLNKTDGLLGAGWIYDPASQFANFAIGDAVKVWNYATPVTMDGADFTIINKQGNGLIQLDHAVPTIGNNVAHASISISNKTPITAIKYHFNFIKNNSAPSFISAVDGVSDQMFFTQYKLASDTSSSPMKANGGYEWQDGHSNGGTPPIAMEYDFGFSAIRPCTIAGVSIDAGTSDGIYKSNFKIIHYTKITPFLLYQQAIPPFIGANCLKLITQIEALELFTNPNFLQSEVFTPLLGNTGYYGSNFATGITNYKIANLAYTNSGGTQDIQLDTTETTIEFDVINTVDTPFAAGMVYTIGFHKVPNDPSEYQNTGNLMDVNFLYDKLFEETVGGIVYNGQNYGGAYQILKGYAASVTSTSILHIKVGVKMASAVIAAFEASGNPQYFMSIAIRNYLLATNVGDDVQLEIDQNGFSVITSDPTMIVFDPKNRILRHPEIDPITEGINIGSTINPFPEDELSAYSEFYIESATRLLDVIKIQSVQCEIVSDNGLGIVMSLDKFNMPLGAYPLIGYTQFFDTVVADQFHIPIAEDLRKFYRIKRRPDLDTGTRYYFSAQYPVLFRWEYWIAALGIDPSFFDNTLPNNGFNEWWLHYQPNPFTIYYKITVNATKNGTPQQYIQQQQLDAVDYASNLYDAVSNPSGQFTTETIDTYDSTNGNHLTVGGNKYILGYADTQIIAVFTTASMVWIPGINVVVEIGIEAWESGGIAGKRRYSSLWVADNDTWFKPVTTMNGVKSVQLTPTGGASTTTATCLIDYTQLPANISAFKITARIYWNITGTYREECITQKVLLIRGQTSPNTLVPNIPVNPLPGCCNDFVLKVLADASGLPLQNDVSGRLFWFDSIITAGYLKLYKFVGGVWVVEIADMTANSSCGTPYAFNFFTNIDGQKFLGYKMDWASVKANHGLGSYKIQVNYTDPIQGALSFYDYEFCLQAYSKQLAEGTVRIESWMNGITGDIEDDTKYKDFGNLNWYNSIRINGWFGFPTSEFKKENTQYNTGRFWNVEFDKTPMFYAHLRQLPFFIHQIIEDFIMGDRLAITDYNSKNLTNAIQKFVIIESGYKPDYKKLQSNLSSVELQFSPETNRFRKLRS